MYNKITLKLKRVYQESTGWKKVGSLKKILWDGFSGTVDLQMEDVFQMLTLFKLKGGKILHDM